MGLHNMNEANISYQSHRKDHTRLKFDGLQISGLKGRSYLDIGCNSGMFCQFAVEGGAVDVVGIDIDSRLIELAKKSVPQASFVVSRFEDIDLGAQQFDVVTIASAIHYSLDFIAVANIILGLVKEDGLLVIEGGLFDPAGNSDLNVPVPGWRKVGDHCRQLSLGFASDVLFPSCNVTLIGPSLNQGGDNLARYVLHVSRSKTKIAKPAKKVVAKLDIEAFIRAMAISFDTIDPKYSMFQHMNKIKLAALMGPGKYQEHLNEPEVVDLIAREIKYCTTDWASHVEIVDSYESKLGHDLALLL